MFNEGGDGWYISKVEVMGLADIGASSGGVGKGNQKDPDLVVREMAMG